jgi:tetratricopeptide (TPR) repeat protein
MSLLLEALKKAEKAKEEAQRRSRGEAAPPAEPEALPAREPAVPSLAEPAPEPVITRDQLPDVRQPLALEDEPQPAPSKAAPAPQPEKRRPEPQPAAQAATQAATQAAQRDTARKVFEAKFKEPNPRLPFFITMGALGVFAVGTVIYFWIQLRPPAALVNTNPARPQNETQIAAADLKPTPALSSPAPVAAIPGLPVTSIAPPARPAAQAPPQPPVTPPAPAARPAEVPRIPAPPPRAAPAEITASRPVPQIHPGIASGYAAYLAGDLTAARTEYEKALKDEPSNRDALLGLAALDVRAGRFESAEAAYLRLLSADPRDAHALAALVALRAGRGDPVNTESRVKSMLAEAPGAHVLNFTLGNQFAQQGRWAEAQQEYFKAFTAEPDNADFAYNLAVSLDHLRQSKLALDYYQRAITLAKARGARFDLAAAESRVAQLSR